MSQPDWKFLDNLGDADPIENGGYFVYHDETNVYGYEAEKLEEPSDRCRRCENEPDPDFSAAADDLRYERDDEIAAFCENTALDPDSDAFAQEVERIKRAYEPRINQTVEDARKDYQAWKEHVQTHERWTVYRIELEQFKIVRKYDIDARKVTRYLVPVAYADNWLHPPSAYQPWFFESLDAIAASASTTKYALIKALCGRDPITLAHAWRDILSYHGWENGDAYPITLSRPEVEARYRDELK